MLVMEGLLFNLSCRELNKINIASFHVTRFMERLSFSKLFLWINMNSLGCSIIFASSTVKNLER